MRLFNKLLWVCAVVLFATPAAFSQDIIVFKDKASDEIQVKVLEVTKKSVTYKKWSYQDGPTFTLEVDKILAIKYQNGEMQTFVKEKKSDSKEKSVKTREDKKVVSEVSTSKTVDAQVVKADDTSQIYSLSRSQTTSPATSTTTANNVAAAGNVSESVSTPKSSVLPAKLQSTKLYSPSDFAEYGISYFAGFEYPAEGHYMIGGQGFNDNGIGGEFRIGFNYGLVDSDYASVLLLVGPAYGYAIDKLFISTSLNFCGLYIPDYGFECGVALMPKVALKLGKVQPWFGVNASYGAGADDVAFGFQVGVGFAL